MTAGKVKFIMALIVLAFLAGVGCLVGGVENYSLARKCRSEPQVLTISQLLSRGPGDNAYIRLTDVTPLVDSTVIEKERSEWKTTYTPLAGSGDADDAAPRVIYASDSIHKDADLDALSGKHVIEGVVGVWSTELKSDAQNLLRKSLPSMDPSKCYILSDETPPSRIGALILLSVGVIFLIVGLTMGMVVRTRKWGRFLEKPELRTFGVAPLFQPPPTAPPGSVPPTAYAPPGQPPQSRVPAYAPPLPSPGYAAPVPPRRGTDGFGIAALVVGIIALLVSWIPLCGMAAIPLAIIGLLLAVVGVIVCLAGGKARPGMSIAGGIICLAAIGVQVLVTFGLLAWGAHNAEMQQRHAATQPATTQSTTEPTTPDPATQPA